MKRRDFIRNAALASAVLMVPDFLKAGTRMLPEGSITGKKLVVIQLSGGNDGLNTVIPFENEIYYKLRKKIAISAKEVLRLGDDLAFHPSLSFLHSLFDREELCIINNVGYPNPDRSHFRSMDIWHSASDANEFLSTGWLGRYLDHYGKTAHDVIETDAASSLAVRGTERKGLAVNDPKSLYLMIREDLFATLAQKHDLEHQVNMSYLYKTLTETSESANYLFEKNKVYDQTQEYPGTGIGRQLKTAASFICSGLETQVYYLSHGGFDTHVAQTGKHAALLSQLNDGLQAFVKELKHKGQWKDTLVLLFSEFGRRVAANASGGTDHGAANNVLILGGSLKKKGVLNPGPDLSDLDGNGDLKFRVDFRSIYSTILGSWLGADKRKILLKDFQELGFV